MFSANLQHLIDQHPMLFVAIFPFYFIIIWLLVGAINSYVGGWFSLARVYRTRVVFNGARWRMQSGQMRWLANYNNMSGDVRSTEARFCWIAAIQLANALLSLTLSVMGSLRANTHTTGLLRTVELGVLTDRAQKDLTVEISASQKHCGHKTRTHDFQ